MEFAYPNKMNKTELLSKLKSKYQEIRLTPLTKGYAKYKDCDEWIKNEEQKYLEETADWMLKQPDFDVLLSSLVYVPQMDIKTRTHKK